jgi:hypothetical protein
VSRYVSGLMHVTDGDVERLTTALDAATQQ